MRTTIRRDRIVDLVIGNRRSFAIHFDFVMIADHAALRRAMCHRSWPTPVICFLRERTHTQEYGYHADYRYPSPNIRDHKTFSHWDKKTPMRRLDATT